MPTPRGGVQQWRRVGSLAQSAGELPALRRPRNSPKVTGAELCAFVDDTMVALPPEKSLDMTVVATIMT